MQHNYSDLGILHPGCPACDFLIWVFGLDVHTPPELPANVPVTSVHYLPENTGGSDVFSPSAPANVFIGSPMTFSPVGSTDDDVEQRADIQGQEMGNKPTVMAERAGEQKSYAEALSYVEWLLSIAAAGGNMSKVSMLAHLHEEHEGYTMPRQAVFRLAQMAHGLLHELGVGHSDSPEHMVPPFNVELWKSRRRHLAQKRDSEYARQRRHARHLDRQDAARAQRRQAQIDSARALQRATKHALGTIGNRVISSKAGAVDITLGTNRPLTLAQVFCNFNNVVYTGTGTALCREGDHWQPEIGSKLALGRALQSLGLLLEHDALVASEEADERP